MSRYYAGLLACGLIAFASGTVQAQEGLRGAGDAIGGFHLIAEPAIQRELGMNDSQVARAKEVASRMNARFQQDMSKLKGLNEDQKKKRVMSLAAAHYEEGMNQIRPFLKPAQLDRFDQILFQLRGPMAMLEPKVVQALQVTNAQAQQVVDLVAQTHTEQEAAAKSAGPQTRAAAMKVESIAAEASEKVFGILSPEQQRTWARIVGKPFRPFQGAGQDEPARAEPAKPEGKL